MLYKIGRLFFSRTIFWFIFQYTDVGCLVVNDVVCYNNDGDFASWFYFAKDVDRFYDGLKTKFTTVNSRRLLPFL